MIIVIIHKFCLLHISSGRLDHISWQGDIYLGRTYLAFASLHITCNDPHQKGQIWAFAAPWGRVWVLECVCGNWSSGSSRGRLPCDASCWCTRTSCHLKQQQENMYRKNTARDWLSIYWRTLRAIYIYFCNMEP